MIVRVVVPARRRWANCLALSAVADLRAGARESIEFMEKELTLKEKITASNGTSTVTVTRKESSTTSIMNLNSESNCSYCGEQVQTCW